MKRTIVKADKTGQLHNNEEEKRSRTFYQIFLLSKTKMLESCRKTDRTDMTNTIVLFEQFIFHQVSIVVFNRPCQTPKSGFPYC